MKSKKSTPIEQQLLLPRENPDFIGHTETLADIFTACSSSNLPGGWLISGQKGIGKATLAYRMARFILFHGAKQSGSLFAPEPPAADLSIPQNSQTFAKVSAGSHPDLLVLESGAADAKSANGDILVDDARKIGSFLHLTSSETAYRIIIIDSIDDMNQNAANSILKLLEEPPANAMFILISHTPGRLLPTIRSRCRHIKMQPPEITEAGRVFKTIAPEVSEDIAHSLLELASGSPGGAYDLYINKGFEIYEKIIGIIAQLPKTDILAIQKLGESLTGKANENSWRIFRVLLNKIIVDIARQTALERCPGSIEGKKNNAKFKLTVAIGAEKLVELWEEINYLLEDADNLHLERKATLLKIFNLLANR